MQTALLSDPARLIGLAIGCSGVALSMVLKSIDPGGMVADPLPLALAVSGVSQLFRGGFLYYDWQSPLLHLIYLAGLSLAAVFAVRAFPRPAFNLAQVQRTAWHAAAANAALTAVLGIDSLLVAVFYLISGFFSVTITVGVAGRLFTLVRRIVTRRRG